MRLREIAQIALTAAEMSRRHGQTFRLDHRRLRGMGVSNKDIGRVEKVVRDIEQYTEDALQALEQNGAKNAD